MNWLSGMSVEERIKEAETKLENAKDDLLRLILLTENNKHVVYSKILSEQIPTSIEAEIFNASTAAQHERSVIRLTAIWDSQSRDRNSLPTIINLIDEEEVRIVLEAKNRGAVKALGSACALSKSLSENGELTSLKHFRHDKIAHSLGELDATHTAKYGAEDDLVGPTLETFQHLSYAINGKNINFSIYQSDAAAAAKSLWENCHFTLK